MHSEYSTLTARKAVSLLRAAAVEKGSSFNKQAKILGIGNHAISARYANGDMRVSEFFTLANAFGQRASDIVKQAELITEQQKANIKQRSTDE